MGLCWCSQVDDGMNTNKRGGVVMPTKDIHVNLEIKGCSTAEDVMRYVYDGRKNIYHKSILTFRDH